MGTTKEEEEARRIITARPKPRRMRHIPTPPPLERRTSGPESESDGEDRAEPAEE